uniref:Uncharacterized protein n=1 Tax=Ditylenchus dipsaci TaxID=166011 RepID=A0A915EPZ4_9BILA
MANAFQDVCSIEVVIQYLEDNNEEEMEETDGTAETFIESAVPVRVKCFAHDIQPVILELFKQHIFQILDTRK